MAEIIDHIILIGVVQGVLLTGGLTVRNWGKKNQNGYFLLLVGLITFTLASHYFYSSEVYTQLPQLWYVADTVAYFIGPLWYWTILKSSRERLQFRWQELAWLLPVLPQIAFVAYLATLHPNTIIAEERSGAFNPWFMLFCITVLWTNGSYLVRAHLVWRRYRNPQFPSLLLRGQYIMLGIVGIWVLAFAASFLLSNYLAINLLAYRFAFMSFAFLTFGLAFMALVRPEAFYFLTQTYDHSEHFVLQQIAHQATQYIETHQPFLESSFSLPQLAEEIHSNPVLTSKAINSVLGTSYSDLMNGYRVKHFLKLAREERFRQLTHWAIAQEAGFGNKTSFYKAFKKSMGMTPKAYLTQYPAEQGL